MDGKHILFNDPRRWTTILNLKHHVQKHTGIPVHAQEHYFGSSEVVSSLSTFSWAEVKAQEPFADNKTISRCRLDEFPKVLVLTTAQIGDRSGNQDDHNKKPHLHNLKRDKKLQEKYELELPQDGDLSGDQNGTNIKILQRNANCDKTRRDQCELEILQNVSIRELTTTQMKSLLEKSGSNARQPPPDIAHIAHTVFVENKESVRIPSTQEHIEDIICHVLFLFVKKNYPDIHLRYDASLVADFILQGTPNEELHRILSLYSQHDTCAERDAHKNGIRMLNRKVKEAVGAFEEHDYHLIEGACSCC